MRCKRLMSSLMGQDSYYTWRLFRRGWQIRLFGAPWLLRKTAVQNAVHVREDRPYDLLFPGDQAERIEKLVGPYACEIDWPLGFIWNGWFQSGDMEVYYSILRELKPKRIIEVGSGYATRAAIKALRKNQNGATVTCIDPEPRRNPPAGVEHLACKVEAVDLSLFDHLQSGDVLFIDSSHTGEEARYHAEHILPRIAPGVVTHHHDFNYPYQHQFDEETVILDYYTQHADSHEVIATLAFSYWQDRAKATRSIRSAGYCPRELCPKSLWVRKLKQ